jgi:hypothetical protein
MFGGIRNLQQHYLSQIILVLPPIICAKVLISLLLLAGTALMGRAYSLMLRVNCSAELIFDWTNFGMQDNGPISEERFLSGV